MRFYALLFVALGFPCLSVLVAQDPAAAEKPALSAADAKAVLEKAGLKVSATGVTMPDEQEFSKSMRELDAVRKTFVAAEKEHAAVEAEGEKIQKTISQMKAQKIQMDAAFASGKLGVNEHNRLVGLVNATSGQIDLLLDQLDKTNDKAKTSRGKAAEARENYITKILAARTAAEKVGNAWSKISTDAEATAALQKVAEVLKKQIPAKPTQTFALAEKQLSLLEQKVLSESIKLTEDSGTFSVSVLIDGKHTQEMIVDSGATTISLPFALAKEMGLEPTSQDKQIRVGLADGSEVPGFLKTIPSVRVGKFTVEDVECVVLSPQARNAPPLLGMSFLGNFKFEIDKNKAELKMVKIDQDSSAKK